MTPEQIGLAVAGLIILAGAGLLARRFFRRKPTPEEIERRRRLDIYQQGKLGDGEIVDVDPERPLITYSYSVAGVGYTVAQEVAALRAMLPDDLMSMLGRVSIKFKPQNPANSIVLCEEWSGLRLKRPFPLPAEPRA
jgi:hypothetical protein